MRRVAPRDRIHSFLRALGRRTTDPARIYLVGGATAVLVGWRESTIDIDLKLVPDRDELLATIARLEEELAVNVELASPDLFIPVAPGWEDRSPWLRRKGGRPDPERPRRSLRIRAVGLPT